MSSMADAAANRELKARVTALEAQIADLIRRMDDQSKAHRIIADKINLTDLSTPRPTLGLKRG